MKEVKKTKRFRDELLNTLMFHAMIPFIIALLVLVLLFAVIGSARARQEGEQLQEETGRLFAATYAAYRDKVYDLSYELDVPRFEAEPVYRANIIRNVADFIQQQTYRGSFYIFDKNYEVVYQGGNAAFKEQLTTYLPYCTQERLGLIYAQDPSGGSITAAWTIMRPIIIGDITGYEGFVIPVSYFSEIFHPAGSQTVILSDVYGRVYSDETSLFWNQKKDMVDSLRHANGFTHLNNSWYYVTPQKVYEERLCVTVISDIDGMVSLIVIVLLLGTILFVIISLFIYRSAGRTATKHTEILYEIIDALDRVEAGNFDISLDIRSGDEFERIGESFNTMTSSISELLRKERSLAEEQLTAEMQVMESQFNPRFLMNSLDAIRYLIRLDPEDASQMTISLSRLLQYSINYEDEMVSLEREIDFVTRYLQFIRFRYGQRLKYTFKIDEACLSCVVPRMILQPLVEVSMRYSLKEDEGYLSLTIEGRIDDDKLILVVSDDGEGLSDVELSRLQDALRRVNQKFSPVGAYSVNKRIFLLYGEGYGLHVGNNPERGARLTLTLPKILDVSNSSLRRR